MFLGQTSVFLVARHHHTVLGERARGLLGGDVWVCVTLHSDGGFYLPGSLVSFSTKFILSCEAVDAPTC